MPDFASRIEAVREEMRRRGIGLLYLPESSALEYLTGIRRDIPNPTEDNRPGDWVAGMYLGLEAGRAAGRLVSFGRRSRRTQNMPFLFLAVAGSGIGCTASQCSSTLPLSSRRNRSKIALPRWPGSRTAWTCTIT